MKKMSSVLLLMISLSLLLLTGCDGVVTPQNNIESNLQDIQTEANDGEFVDTGNMETIEGDTTDTNITVSRDPLPNSAGWNNTDVTITFTSNSISKKQSDNQTNNKEVVIVTTEGKDQSVTSTIKYIDAAGNVGDPVTVSGINIDKTPPVLTINLPKNGKYKVNESITVTWTARDNLSGVKTSKAPKKFDLDTNTKGKKTFTLPAGTVEDEAGNTSEEVIVSYEVVEEETTEEEPVIIDPQDPNTIYPQKWATGNGTKNNPWANGCIEKAIAAAVAGDTIYLRPGYYQLAGEAAINKHNLTIMGAGIGKTIVLTGDAHGFTVNRYDYVTIKHLTVDGDAQKDGKAHLSPVYFANCNYPVLKNVEVKNAGYYGVNPYQVNHGLFENLLLHNNWVHGIHPGAQVANTNMYNTYRNIDAWDNRVMGFSDRGTGQSNPLIALQDCGNVYDNIRAWNNGSHGIQVSYQKGATIKDCEAWDNGSGGFRFESLADSTIENCTLSGNSITSEVGSISISARKEHPTYVIDGLVFTNVTVKNTFKRSGIRLSGYVKEVHFIDCISNDDQATMTQTYGLRLGGTGIDDYAVTLKNCTLTPNKDGDIYNPNNLALNITTEKSYSIFRNIFCSNSISLLIFSKIC